MNQPQKINYDQKMQEIINQIGTTKPKLLLHSCCAPCSTTVIKRLIDYFEITILYYNPNIEPESEYLHRKSEQIRLVKELSKTSKIQILDIDYENELYRQKVEGLENEKEGGIRCHACFHLRLNKTACVAKEKNFAYFGTTLTVSPHKNSQIINTIGAEISTHHQIPFLFADFKKHDGYLQSIKLANNYKLYRQDYCGCLFSKTK